MWVPFHGSQVICLPNMQIKCSNFKHNGWRRITCYSSAVTHLHPYFPAATVPIAVSQPINIRLDFQETSFFEYSIPEEGITVKLLQQEGTASLFASSRVRNPNAAFYDFRIDGKGEVFVDPTELFGDWERRNSDSDVGDDGSGLNMLFEGTGRETNSFQILTSTGNTVGEF